MLVIYNASGLLVGLAGAAAGVVILVLGTLVGLPPLVSLALGVLAVAAVWFVLGILWRASSPPNQPKRPWPALFFIPLPLAAVPVAVLAMPLLIAGAIVGNVAPDPRMTDLNADERKLDAQVTSGDVALSRSLLKALQALSLKEAGADAYHVYTRTTDDAVLVLIKAPNLKKYAKPAREELLQVIVDLLDANDATRGKKAYVAVKGRLNFGSLRAPPKTVRVDDFVPKAELLGFYGPAPVPNATK